MVKVVVVGAGVIGLSSALHVLEKCPSAKVTIFAESFPPNTTTNVSAGFWLPHILGNTPQHLIRKWSGTTLKHMQRLAWSDSAKYTGAIILSGYELSAEENPETPFWGDMVRNFRRVNKDELSDYPGMKSGFFFTSAMVEPGPYLEFLMKRVQRKGAKMKRRRITSLEELAREGYDVIVNCSGLGARDIGRDTSMEPVRGQVIRTKAPWLSHFFGFVEDNGDICYIIPGMSYVVVGGTADVGVESTAISSIDTNAIWKRGIKYCPSLAEATIESEHVGLRPARPQTVRLEQEILNINGKSQVVVHNYGHGGGGVTLHWGCAEDTADLVKQAIENSYFKSKL